MLLGALIEQLQANTSREQNYPSRAVSKALAIAFNKHNVSCLRQCSGQLLPCEAPALNDVTASRSRSRYPSTHNFSTGLRLALLFLRRALFILTPLLFALLLLACELSLALYLFLCLSPLLLIPLLGHACVLDDFIATARVEGAEPSDSKEDQSAPDGQGKWNVQFHRHGVP